MDTYEITYDLSDCQYPATQSWLTLDGLYQHADYLIRHGWHILGVRRVTADE